MQGALEIIHKIEEKYIPKYTSPIWQGRYKNAKMKAHRITKVGDKVKVTGVSFDHQCHLYGKEAKVIGYDTEGDAVLEIYHNGKRDIISSVGLAITIIKMVDENKGAISRVVKWLWNGIKSLFKK